MVGAKHTPNEPHPSLDYKIVAMTKYIDNRVKDKVKRNIVNITKSFETLNSLTARFQASKNNLDFSETKNKTYISDIYLSQDKKANIQGAFVVDKLEIIKNLTAYPFLFDNAKQSLTQSRYKSFLNNMMQLATLEKLLIYEKDELLGQITQNENFISFDVKGKSQNQAGYKTDQEKIVINKNNFDLPETESTTGLEYFSFKHFAPALVGSENKYRIEAEYKDPTIDYVRELVLGLTPAIESVSKLVSFASVDKKSGFDTTTEKLKSLTIQKIINNQPPYDQVPVTELGDNYTVIKDVYDYFTSPDFSVFTFFYSPDVSFADFVNYFLKLSNLYTATLTDLLLLEDFLTDLKSKLLQTLSSFGSKPAKSTNPQFYGQLKQQGDIEASLGTKIIQVSSKDNNKFIATDYGYDFLGYLDKNFQDTTLTLEGVSGRRTFNFTEVLVDDYINSCLFLFSKIIPKSATDGDTISESLKETFTPKGLPTATPETSAYSYLSLPIRFIKSCVMLPATVLDYSFFSDSTPVETIAQRIFTNVLKFNSGINIENSINPEQVGSDQKKQNLSLQKDSLSFLKKSGFDIVNLTKINLSDSNGLVEEDTNQESSSENQGIQSLISPGIQNLIGNSFLPKQDLQVFTAADNFLISSFVSRKLFSEAGSFKLNMSKEDFLPYPSGIFGNLTFFFVHSVGGLPTLPPLQVLSLATATDNIGPFRDYSATDQNYIRNGVINPLLLSFFWFKHQNIVRVEYLSGFEESSETVYLKDKSNPYEQGPQKTITRRNVNKPVWRTVNKELLDSLSDPTSSVKKVLCRLVRYNYSYYINKKLVNEANLPLVNNYFILSQQSTDTGDNVITPGQAIGQTQLNTGPVQVIAQDPSNLQAPGGPLPGLLPGGGT